MDEQIELQELYCHNCGRYVQFPIDLSMSGSYVLNCPKCGHEHCRIVRDGVITDDRWASSNLNLQTFHVSSRAITTSATSASTNGTNWKLYSSAYTTTSVSTFIWAGS
jgi:DNA-directed RNA polymerase subunit RPC12/RpoP